MANCRHTLLLGICAWNLLPGLAGPVRGAEIPPTSSANQHRSSAPAIIFNSAGKTAVVASDGTGLRWLDFDVPHQSTWQVAGFFSDGRWLLLSMEPRRDGPGRPSDQDPGHDWSDLCVGRPDGSENRLLTHGQSQWFAATYGPPSRHGGGSNLPVWTPDGQLLFSRRLPGSKVPWQYQPQRPDVDHFNRDYQPDAARGGTEICRCDPETGRTIRLTHSEPPVWDFRARVSPDGHQIVFCRAATGQVPSLWIINADGADARRIATGRDGRGVDQPRWIPNG